MLPGPAELVFWSTKRGQGLALAHSQQPTPTQIDDVNIHARKQITVSET